MNKLLLASVFLILVACGTKEESESAVSTAPEAVTPAAPQAESTLVVEDVKISSLKLGKAVDADKKVAADTVGFTKADTIYAGVEVTGKGKAQLKATWTHIHGDKVTVINESEQTLESAGVVTTEFHVSNLSNVGDYKVEVKLNDTLSETKSFSVSD